MAGPMLYRVVERELKTQNSQLKTEFLVFATIRT